MKLLKIFLVILSTSFSIAHGKSLMDACRDQLSPGRAQANTESFVLACVRLAKEKNLSASDISGAGCRESAMSWFGGSFTTNSYGGYVCLTNLFGQGSDRIVDRRDDPQPAAKIKCTIEFSQAGATLKTETIRVTPQKFPKSSYTLGNKFVEMGLFVEDLEDTPIRHIQITWDLKDTKTKELTTGHSDGFDALKATLQFGALTVIADCI